MEWVAAFFVVLLGIALGYLLGQRRSGAAETQLAEMKTRMEETQKRREEEKRFFEEAKSQLGDTFRSLAADALRQNNEGFLALAGQNLGAVRGAAANDLEIRKKEIEELPIVQSAPRTMILPPGEDPDGD